MIDQHRDGSEQLTQSPQERDVDGEVAKLSDVAYARIAAGIASGDYAVGSRLPTENRLAELLGVSRPVVREALARLRDNGMVISRRGSGTYVRRAPEASDRGLAPLSSIADMRRCLEFRISFEGETAYHAALVRPPDIDDSLLEARDRLEAAMREYQISIEDDFAFHLAIAEATGNRFFFAALREIKSSITTGMAITRSFELLGTREQIEALHEEHLAIFAAINAKDAKGARQAMQWHLENAMHRVFEGTL